MSENLLSPAERGDVLAAACPSRQILQHLTSRWGVLIMVVLRDGTKRFSEIRNAIDGVSERMLTQTLQNLEQDGMLIRKSYHTVPPHVDYTLTPYGEQAAEKIYHLVDWLEENLEAILAESPKE
ncbi:winged helix-turn-helix transcriptional regulator [Neisseria yangbaofengii]|uniref:winged helix-turn-helix transcriptional regulator n=3 Tax=Neisseria yangbaofengii TaxID=2709396 RepID=UPI0013EBD977|nr:helix-turn-helix domain-containing protein [Neisseria yangbaofengii]